MIDWAAFLWGMGMGFLVGIGVAANHYWNVGFTAAKTGEERRRSQRRIRVEAQKGGQE